MYTKSGNRNVFKKDLPNVKYKTNGFLLNSSSPSFVSSIHIQGCILSTGQFKDEQHFTFMYLNLVKDELTPGGQSMEKLRHSRC